MVCVIGGASRGIGQGISVRFAVGGATVCVLGRSDGKIVTGPGTLSNVVSQIDAVGGKGKGLAVQCDLSKAEQVGMAQCPQQAEQVGSCEDRAVQHGLAATADEKRPREQRGQAVRRRGLPFVYAQHAQAANVAAAPALLRQWRPAPNAT